MEKRIRQYMGWISGIAGYYLVHEGAHLLCSWGMGSYRAVRFLGLGIQIDLYGEQMSSLQMGLFCLCGVLATAAAGYGLTALTVVICKHPSRLYKACMYYLTMAFLFVDPLYLSVLYGLFGGGDMNGITLLVPESATRVGFGCILLLNVALFAKKILPRYKQAFSN